MLANFRVRRRRVAVNYVKIGRPCQRDKNEDPLSSASGASSGRPDLDSCSNVGRRKVCRKSLLALQKRLRGKINPIHQRVRSVRTTGEPDAAEESAV